MGKELRILIVEDSPADAELEEYELRKSGLVFTSKVVDTKEAFLKELDEFSPDLILSDYDLPAFDGLAALRIAQEKCPDVPFILVTGKLGEEFAIEKLKDGAKDYVLKSNLKRLVPVIKRALEEAKQIAERKQADKALRESEARLRAIFDATPFPIALVDLQDNNIEFWSRSALTLFGHTAPTASGWYEIAYPDPDYRRDVIGRWKPILEKERLSAQAVNTGEYRVTCRDGSVRICELYAAFLAENLIVTFNDITERKRAEEALRTSNLIIEGIINAIPVRVFWKDKDLVYLGCNEIFARDAGFKDPKDIIGKDDYQMGWRDQAELYRADDRHVIESGFPKHLIEEPQTTIEGNQITLLTSKIPLRNSEGEIIGVLGTYMDITSRKTEKQIQKNVKELEESYDIAIGTELRMNELKEEIESLKVELAKYKKQ